MLEAGGPRAHAEPAVIVGFLPGFTVEILLMLPKERAGQARQTTQRKTLGSAWDRAAGSNKQTRSKSTHEQVEISVERSSLWEIFQWILGRKIRGRTQGCRANGS